GGGPTVGGAGAYVDRRRARVEVQSCRPAAELPGDAETGAGQRQVCTVGPAGEELLGERRAVVGGMGFVSEDRQPAVGPQPAERRAGPQPGERSPDYDDSGAVESRAHATGSPVAASWAG